MNESKQDFTFISPEEACPILGIGICTMYKLLKEDPTFSAKKIERKWIILKEALPQWLLNEVK